MHFYTLQRSWTFPIYEPSNRFAKENEDLGLSELRNSNSIVALSPCPSHRFFSSRSCEDTDELSVHANLYPPTATRWNNPSAFGQSSDTAQESRGSLKSDLKAPRDSARHTIDYQLRHEYIFPVVDFDGGEGESPLHWANIHSIYVDENMRRVLRKPLDIIRGRFVPIPLTSDGRLDTEARDEWFRKLDAHIMNSNEENETVDNLHDHQSRTRNSMRPGQASILRSKPVPIPKVRRRV